MLTEVFQKLDKFLLLCLLLIACLGMTVLYAAVYQGNHGIFQKQCLYWLVGLLAFFSMCFVPLRQFALMAWPFYSLSLLCLALVPLVGDVHMGARRWLDLGVVSFQPSEMMKWALMLVLAHWFASREPNTLKNFFMAIALCGVPAALIVIQPDLGTTLVLLFAAIVVLMVSGFAWKWFLGALAISPVVAYFLWGHLHDYQKQRVLTFIDPQTDPLGAGYHVIQSMIAIGSGGLFGKGFLEGTQVRLHFLPEQHTDFIFSVLAEEFGLLGVAILLILYGLLIARMLSIASHAHTRFGSLLVTGISAIFLLYAFVNIGMVSGILPVVGVPLPFISYGGSALLTMVTALGIVMRVAIESKGVIPWQRANNPLV